MVYKFLLILFISAAYTLVRYVVFADVSLSHAPVYLLNKTLSLSAATCLLLVSTHHLKNNQEKIKFWGKATFHTGFLHIILSMSILSKAYYPKFYSIDKLTFFGELMILCGGLAAYILFLLRRNNLTVRQYHVYHIAFSLLICGHLVFMGFKGWINVSGWHGNLPPISLISFIFASISFIFFLKPRKSCSENL